MNKTIITHFYNEEYLLPWWIQHHKKYFDHGILIDYHSTDRSVSIVKDLAPEWTLVTTRNQWFQADAVDREVMDIESQIHGWKIAINTTEFLIGDFSTLTDEPDQLFTVPCSVMVDHEPFKGKDLTYNKSLISQKPYGILHNEGGTAIRSYRAFHNKKVENYSPGRHYREDINRNDKLHILWYGWSPFTDETVKRKLTVQTRIPQIDKDRGFGREHLVTYNDLMSQFYTRFQPKSRDLTTEINKLWNE